MGIFLSKLYEALSKLGEGGVPARILLLGLDGAGKTTILYKVKLNENVATIPTIGFNVETVSPVKGVTFTMWDVGGQTKIRPLWRHYFQGAKGLVYVVDSTDVDRVSEAAAELRNVCDDEDMRGVPVVILANKQDLPNALPCAKLIEKLNLANLGHKWHIQGSCAVTGEGVYEGLNKMAEFIKD